MNIPLHHLPGRLLLTFVLIAALNNCSTGSKPQPILPDAAALQRVHEAYRQDFVRAAAPKTAEEEPSANFSNTLGEIKSFRENHADKEKELAHVTVLQGMIYLQSGQLGLAQGIKADVATAATRLRSGTGRPTRDQLFAQAFDPLLRGWQGAKDQMNNVQLRQIGSEIRSLLDGQAPKPSNDKDLDDGAIYLAATAVAFWTPYIANAKPDVQKQMATDGYQLMGRYLTPDEEQTARTNPAAGEVGRRRYLEVYRTMWNEAGKPDALASR